MVWLGFEPGPQDVRRGQNHRAMAAGNLSGFITTILGLKDYPTDKQESKHWHTHKRKLSLLIPLKNNLWFSHHYAHTQCDQTLKYKGAKNILTKVAQNFINDNGCFQKAKTVNIHLGNFCNKICHQYLLKIAKSGPTVTRGSSYLYPDRENRRYCR